MSRHSDLVRLRHMLDHAREAVALVAGKDRTDLANTRLLQLGLVRLVEIIGEAAARVSNAQGSEETDQDAGTIVGGKETKDATSPPTMPPPCR